MNDVITIRVTTDPHHDGSCSWLWDGRRLYHKDEGQTKWTPVRNVSFTVRRITALAALVSTSDTVAPVGTRPAGPAVGGETEQLEAIVEAAEALVMASRTNWPNESGVAVPLSAIGMLADSLMKYRREKIRKTLADLAALSEPQPETRSHACVPNPNALKTCDICDAPIVEHDNDA